MSENNTTPEQLKAAMVSHQREFLSDLKATRRGHYNQLMANSRKGTLAADLLRLYQADRADLESCYKLITIGQGADRRTLVDFNLPLNNPMTTKIQLLLTQDPELNYLSETGEQVVLKDQGYTKADA